MYIVMGFTMPSAGRGGGGSNVRETNMADDVKSPLTAGKPVENAKVIKTSGLLAEYTTGRSISGEWFALGSVREEIALDGRQPAWLIVGTGRSPEDAVSRLLTELEHEAQRHFR